MDVLQGMDSSGVQDDVDIGDEPDEPMDVDEVLDFPDGYENNEFNVVQHQMYVFSSLDFLTQCPTNASISSGDKVKIKTLKPLCAKYGLAVSGKKAELQKRLREFSHDRSRWQRFVFTNYDQLTSPYISSILPGARRSHKGSKDARKLSTRRREKLFGSDTTQLDSGKRVIHSSAAQMEAKLVWVCFNYLFRSVLI